MPAYGPDPKLDSLSSRGMNIALSHEWEMAPGRGETPMGNYEFNRIINGAVCALRRCRWRRPRGPRCYIQRSTTYTRKIIRILFPRSGLIPFETFLSRALGISRTSNRRTRNVTHEKYGEEVNWFGKLL